jgi:uncharacterized lipoprotein
MRRLIVVSMFVLPFALAGCKLMRPESSTCHERQAYESAGSVAPLHAPEGLAQPNTRNALKIPDLPADVAPRVRGKHDPCLDEPPSFYPDRPKPAAGKS